MIEIMPAPAMQPTELYLHLEKHGLLTEGLFNDPTRLVHMCGISAFYVWSDGDNPVALHIETPTGEPGVMNIVIIPEDKTLGKRLWNDSVAIGAALQLLWFEQGSLRRVQSFVPESRVNMQRIYRAMGFIEETRKQLGLRGYFGFPGKPPQAAQVWSMMKGDPIGKDRVQVAENSCMA